MKTVLVTGARGFVGRHCLPRLVAPDCVVHAMTSAADPEPLDGVTWHRADLLAGEGVAVVDHVRPTHLLHLAWDTTPGEFWTSPVNEDWCRASSTLVQAFADSGGRRVVVTGSGAEYDWTAGECDERSTALLPATPYARWKNALRKGLEERLGDGAVSWAWARLFWLYGPGEPVERLVPSIVTSLLRGEPALCSAGAQRRDYMYVGDAAEALVRLLWSGVPGAVNVASGVAPPVAEIAQTIGEFMGRTELLRLGALESPPDEPPLVVAAVDRLRDEVGFEPSFALSDGVAATVAHWSAVQSVASCPVCRSQSVEGFVARDHVAVHQNLIMGTPEEATAIARGRLDMRCCADCGFVFNAAFDADRLDYGPGYENCQTHSAMFGDYVDDLVRHLVHDRGVRGRRIVEIGCGDGTFLRRLLAEDAGNVGFGYDAAYDGPEVELDGRLRFERRYFGAEDGSTRPDVVVCRHVIEHVAEPVELLQTLRCALGNRRAQIYFETPDVEWILRNRVVWDFFYEHCSLFSADSLATAFGQAGFEVIDTRRVFGDQYLWLEAVPAPAGGTPVRPGAAVAQAARAFTQVEEEITRSWTARVRALRDEGPVAVWGAGAKGVTFTNMVDAERDLIDCVVDVNPAKQGHFLPGTGHPIVGPADLAGRGVLAAVVLNPNYAAEIRDDVRRRGLAVEVVELEPTE